MPASNFWKITQGINLSPKSSAPSSPSNGDMYYNSTSNKFQFYENGSFVTYTTGTGFLKADGSVPLTSNWAAGAFQISLNSILLGSAANAITALRTIASDTSLTFQANGSTTFGSLSSAGLWTLGASGGTQLHVINGSASVTGQIEAAAGTGSLPSVTFAADPTTGLFQNASTQISITAGTVPVGRFRTDGQIDFGVGCQDDDHNTGTSTSDFNYRGQTFRCVTSTTTGVTVAALNRSATSAADAVLKAETAASGGDPYVFLSCNASGFSIGIDQSVSASNLYFCQGAAGVDTSTATIRGAIIGSAWNFGTDTDTTAQHKFIGASARIEANVSGGPAFQVRSLRTAVGAGESLGAYQWYSSDATLSSPGVAGDMRAIETGGTGINYYLTFRSSANGTLVESLRLLETGRALHVDGTTANPAIAAISDPDTGLQFGGSNDLYLVAGGAVKLSLLAASVRFAQQLQSTVSGSFSVPDIAHNADTNTGIVWGQADDLYISTAGSNRVSVTNSSTDLTNILRVKSGGTFGSPNVVCSADTNTGIVWGEADDIYFSTGGSNRFSVDSAGVTGIETGDLKIKTAGKGLFVKEGSNAKMGTSTLSAGTVTVSTTAVTASSRIFLTSQSDGGTPGFQRVTARTAGTSFVITSSNAADTSTVAWMLVEPA